MFYITDTQLQPIEDKDKQGLIQAEILKMLKTGK
jgi:hypothetical protein